MDMYQKRKIRAEKKNNDSQKSFSKVPISWLACIYDDEYIFSACSITIDEDTKKIVDFKNIYEVIKESEI